MPVSLMAMPVSPVAEPVAEPTPVTEPTPVAEQK
jgi:hypothetical protein